MNKTLISRLVAAALCTLPALPARAFEPFQVKDIRVEGIQRTEAGTVFEYLPVKVGETMTDEKASQAVKALFATGFFKDVRLEVEGAVLVVAVEERPAIASVDFVGLKAFEKETIIKNLRDVGLAESRIFDRAMVERAEQELKRQYLTMGYYATQITTTITPLERNRVGINFSIEEGDIAKIRQINVVGNTVFKEKDLLDLFALQTPGWLSWYTKNDQYSKQKISADLETLRSHYMDAGYLEFSIDSTQVSISPNRNDIYITINVTEGAQYTVSAVKLAGDLKLTDDELKPLVKFKPGDVYSRAKVTESTKAITDRLGNDGYAFANVNAAPEINKEKREVAFTLYVDPGRRVYVRNINIAGNNKTRDEVIRQEMRQMESAWYEAEKINKSRTRAEKTSYFESVTVETPPVAGTSDQVDVNINVKERPTGFVMLGLGFSSEQGIGLAGGITQQNLFGSGKYVSAQFNTGDVNTVYSLSYTNPYFTVDGVSAGFDIYRRDVDTTTLSVGDYKTSALGAGLRFGVPISDDDYVNLGLSADNTDLTLFPNSPPQYKDFVDSHNGDTTYSTLLTSLSWTRNSIDSVLYPTSGLITKVTGELATAPASLRFWRLSASYQRYWPLTRTFTLLTNVEGGMADGYAGQELPFFKNFYAGGISSVRGFESGSLGPKVEYAALDEFGNPILDGNGNPTRHSAQLGGTRRLIANAELLFPMPGSGQDKSARLGWFVDAGQVWGTGEKVEFADIRYSTGLSFLWGSPFGPLKFSLGYPINRKTGDDVQPLQFTIGGIF